MARLRHSVSGGPSLRFVGDRGARPKGRRRRAPAGDGRGVPPGVRPGGGGTQGKAGSVSVTVKYVTAIQSRGRSTHDVGSPEFRVTEG